MTWDDTASNERGGVVGSRWDGRRRNGSP